MAEAAEQWTRDRIVALRTADLRTITRSTKPDGRFSDQVRWAREEIDRRATKAED